MPQGPLVVVTKGQSAKDPATMDRSFREIERWSGGVAFYRENVVTVAASGTALIIPDVNAATLFLITLTANCTFTFPTGMSGKNFAMALVQDATGSRTVTWPASVKWSGGTSPTLTTTAAKIDTFSFVNYNNTNWLGYTTGQNF